MTVFAEYFSEYMGTIGGFEKFHNEVINMPRDQFSDTGLNKIRILAGYLLLTEGKLDPSGVNYKATMDCIAEQLREGNYPLYRDNNLEERYFSYTDIDSHYATMGRMFRHLMSMGAFFGFVKSIGRQQKVFIYDKCREYYLADNEILMPIARNNLMILNAKNNDFIKSLHGISISEDTDYRPTYAILRYMQQIDRPVTKFEISVLLGRIDSIKTESNILDRALKIGRVLPKDEETQIPYFFSNMNWKYPDGKHFSYAASQEPHFKFNNYILFLESFELIEYDNTLDLITALYKEEVDAIFIDSEFESLYGKLEEYSDISKKAKVIKTLHMNY